MCLCVNLVLNRTQTSPWCSLIPSKFVGSRNVYARGGRVPAQSMPAAEWTQTLGGLHPRTRAVYQAYLQEREHRGPRGESTPGCRLYDVVQQRTRAYLSPERGCCEPPAVGPPPDEGRCMAGARLLVGIPSFGNDPRTWALLSVVLRSLDDARRVGGIRVEVGLDLTHPVPPSLALPPGLPVTSWQHSTSVKTALAGIYRQRFWAVSHRGPGP